MVWNGLCKDGLVGLCDVVLSGLAASALVLVEGKWYEDSMVVQCDGFVSDTWDDLAKMDMEMVLQWSGLVLEW